MADSTKTYVVTASSIGVVVGEDRRTGVDVVNYHSRGAVVELDQETADRLLGLTPPAIADPEELRKAQEQERRRQEAIAEADRKAAEEEYERVEAERAEAEKAQAAETESTDTGDTSNLTAKQKLVKEAEELGLDSSGTAAELQARIDEKKAADAAGSGS